jgi:hypothetical protein
VAEDINKAGKPTKRVTMKDVANQAGVSTATVSFVLNYSSKEKISHETRLRVFEAAQMLNYVPDISARALARQRHAVERVVGGLVGIIVNLGESNLQSKLYQHYGLVNELQRQLSPLGYDVVFLPTRNLEKELKAGRYGTLEAVFVIDMDCDTAKNMAKRFYVPLIFIDGHIGDPLFHEILVDYDTIFSTSVIAGKTYVVLEDYANDYALQSARKFCPQNDIFVNKKEADPGLAKFLERRKTMRGIVIGEVLGLQVESLAGGKGLTVVVGAKNHILLSPETRTIVVHNKDKAKMAIEIMRKLAELKGEEFTPVTYISPRTGA